MTSIAPSAGVSTPNQNIISSAIYIKYKHCYFYLKKSNIESLVRSDGQRGIDRTDASPGSGAS
ncbi:MAG: hypothetical protein AAAB23_26135, partial [Pseudomonas sp.]